MNVPFYTSTREYLLHKSEFDSAVQGVMAKGDFILGSEVSEFEKECAEYLGVKYAVGVASGSDALIIGADILNFKEGTEVLTPTFTFFASTSCLARLGAKPVFVDIDRDTLNMSIHDAENKISNNTRGIIPVHLFQQPAAMSSIMSMAKQYSLKVLEDSAEAWGMECNIDGTWSKAGTIGDIGIYSFFPTKTLGAYGDAGLIVTNDETYYKKIKSYRVHGSSVKYHHDYIGYNSRLDTLQAAILRVKIKRTEESILLRAKIANRYRSRLQNVQRIQIPQIDKNTKPVSYVFNILAEKRDDLSKFLTSKGIGWSVYYPIPLHLQKCFSYLGYKEGDFPIAEQVCKEIIALPIYPEMHEDEIDYVCDAIELFYK